MLTNPLEFGLIQFGPFKEWCGGGVREMVSGKWWGGEVVMGSGEEE